jgi:predicted dehydrogenase
MLPDHLPRSRVPDPSEAPLLRWGVIGTGWIAERFVDALQSMTRQQVVAVGSRTDEGAGFLGAPIEIIARGIPAPSGVNGQAWALMVHDGDAHSVITTSIFSNTPTGATIAGTEGTITIPGIYYRPGKFTVASGDHKTTHTYEEPPANYAYLAYEAAETAWRIVAGEKSAPYRPMADSVSTMESSTRSAVRSALSSPLNSVPRSRRAEPQSD